MQAMHKINFRAALAIASFLFRDDGNQTQAQDLTSRRRDEETLKRAARPLTFRSAG